MGRKESLLVLNYEINEKQYVSYKCNIPELHGFCEIVDFRRINLQILKVVFYLHVFYIV